MHITHNCAYIQSKDKYMYAVAYGTWYSVFNIQHCGCHSHSHIAIAMPLSLSFSYYRIPYKIEQSPFPSLVYTLYMLSVLSTQSVYSTTPLLTWNSPYLFFLFIRWSRPLKIKCKFMTKTFEKYQNQHKTYIVHSTYIRCILM